MILLAIWCSSISMGISNTHLATHIPIDSGEVGTLIGRDPMTEQAARMHAALTGRWENTLYPFEQNGSSILAGAFLSYNFRADGTYVKTLSGAGKRIEENGRWEVSPDGAMIFLFEAGDVIPETIRIKYIEADELVLEHALKCDDPGFCTHLKSFYFNKSA